MDGGEDLWRDSHNYLYAVGIQLLTSVNHESMESYFNLLEDTLSEHDLVNHPAQIYNMDDSGMPLDARPPNVIAKRGQKQSVSML